MAPGQCKGAPLFFKQCVCDLKSDLMKLFRPKQGFSLIFPPQSIIPIWRKEYAKFYDPDEPKIKLHSRIAHGKHGAKHSLTSDDLARLICQYPAEVHTSMQGRLWVKRKEGRMSKRSPAKPSESLYTRRLCSADRLSKFTYDHSDQCLYRGSVSTLPTQVLCDTNSEIPSGRQRKKHQ